MRLMRDLPPERIEQIAAAAVPHHQHLVGSVADAIRQAFAEATALGPLPAYPPDFIHTSGFVEVVGPPREARKTNGVHHPIVAVAAPAPVESTISTAPAQDGPRPRPPPAPPLPERGPGLVCLSLGEDRDYAGPHPPADPEDDSA